MELAHVFRAALSGRHFSVRDKERWTRVLDSLDGENVDILIRKAVERRNLPQNALLHVLVHAISEHSGEPPWRVKEVAVLETLGPEEGAHSYVKDGQTIYSFKSTADLTKDQCSAAIDWLRRELESQHVPEPDPDKVSAF